MTDQEMTVRNPELQQQIQLADRAKGFIVTYENRIQAEEWILALNEAERRVRDVMDPICDAAHKAHKTATAQRYQWLKPIEEAREHLRRGCAEVRKQLETVEVEPVHARGIAYRENWTFEWVDKDGKPAQQPDLTLIPLAYHMADVSAIRAVVKALKDKTDIPGVNAYSDKKPVETARAKAQYEET